VWKAQQRGIAPFVKSETATRDEAAAALLAESVSPQLEAAIIWAQAQEMNTGGSLVDSIAGHADQFGEYIEAVETFAAVRSTMVAEFEAARSQALLLAFGGKDSVAQFAQALQTLEAGRNDQVFACLEAILLIERGHPARRAPAYADKLWMCATGRMWVHGNIGACKPFWRGADLAKNLPKYFEALESHDQHLWQLKELYYEHTQQHPRHVYRKADQNRLGYSNANPSYWAMGYATLDDFKRMAPAKVVLEYTARNLNPRAQSAWTKGVGGKFELMKTVGTRGLDAHGDSGGGGGGGGGAK